MEAQLNAFNSMVLVCNMEQSEDILSSALESLSIKRHHNTCIWLASGSDDEIRMRDVLASFPSRLDKSSELNHIVCEEAFSFDVLKKLSQDYYVTRVEHLGFE